MIEKKENIRKTVIGITSLLFLLAVLFLLGCTQTDTASNSSEMVTIDFSYTDANGNIIVQKSIDVESGTNALEVMKNNFEVDYDEFEFGVMVNSIDGVQPPEGYYLGLYVDGSFAQAGISSYTISKDTTIEWKTNSLSDFGS